VALNFFGQTHNNNMKTKTTIIKLLFIATVVALFVIGLSKSNAQSAIGLEPYGTIHWRGIDGESDLGAGVGATIGITKNLSLTAFSEGDSTSDPNFLDQIVRAGAGLRYTAWLGSRVSLDGGVQGAWDIENAAFFVRLPLGANIYAVKTENFAIGVRAQYAFDISGKGPNGTARGIASVGPFFSYSF
jgi:hypothetical protein